MVPPLTRHLPSNPKPGSIILNRMEEESTQSSRSAMAGMERLEGTQLQRRPMNGPGRRKQAMECKKIWWRRARSWYWREREREGGGKSQHKYNSSYPHFPEDFEGKQVWMWLNLFECASQLEYVWMCDWSPTQAQIEFKSVWMTPERDSEVAFRIWCLRTNFECGLQVKSWVRFEIWFQSQIRNVNPVLNVSCNFEIGGGMWVIPSVNTQ